MENFKITKEDILKVAERYRLDVSFDKEPGLYVGDEKIEIEELFADFFESSE